MGLDLILGLVVGGALGYALRGSIGKELKTIGTDIKAELAKVVADIKTKV